MQLDQRLSDVSEEGSVSAHSLHEAQSALLVAQQDLEGVAVIVDDHLPAGTTLRRTGDSIQHAIRQVFHQIDELQARCDQSDRSLAEERDRCEELQVRNVQLSESLGQSRIEVETLQRHSHALNSDVGERESLVGHLRAELSRLEEEWQDSRKLLFAAQSTSDEQRRDLQLKDEEVQCSSTWRCAFDDSHSRLVDLSWRLFSRRIWHSSQS